MKTTLLTFGVAALMAACQNPPAEKTETSNAPVTDTSKAQDKRATGIADRGPEHHLQYQPAEIEWQNAPASFEPGAQVAVLEGNPGEAGVFTMRIKMPDGFTIAPHWHPNVERVTVLSGVFLLGAGETLNRETAARLEAGSYTSMPPEMRHYAMSEGETVVQLTSVGPWEIHYINPEDDPRKRN